MLKKPTTDLTIGLRSSLRHVRLCLLAVLAITNQIGHACAGDAERFEVIKVKAVRLALVETVEALEKGDVAGAKTAFAAYDCLW
jgi:hypothetical protein